MSLEFDSLAASCAATRAADGYPSSDGLLRDLQGHAGERARALATGYVMAIHDADADCLGAATLLRYLRGEAGESMSIAATGYVMAVRDCLQAAGAASGDDASHGAWSTMQEDVERVRTWLERHPHDQLQLAISSVQLALAVPVGSSSPTRGRPASVPTWRAQGARALRRYGVHVAGVVMVGGALALAAWSSAHDRLLDHDVELSQQASSVTTLLLEQRRYEKDSFINIGDQGTVDAYGRKWEQARQSMIGTLSRLDALDLSADDRRSVMELSRDFRVYAEGYERLLAQMKSGQVATAQDANQQIEAYKDAAHRVEEIGAELTARASSRLRA